MGATTHGGLRTKQSNTGGHVARMAHWAGRRAAKLASGFALAAGGLLMAAGLGQAGVQCCPSDANCPCPGWTNLTIQYAFSQQPGCLATCCKRSIYSPCGSGYNGGSCIVRTAVPFQSCE